MQPPTKTRPDSLTALVGRSVAEIDTPALVVDLDAMQRNIARMAEFARKHEVRWRPHAKMHKCAALARLQLQAGAVGVCVQKTAEAEAMAAGGVNDIYISNEVIAPRKLARVAALAHRLQAQGGRVAIAVDGTEGVTRLAQAMNDARGEHGTPVVIDVFVEIDVGQGRCGVPPGPAAVALVHEIRRHPALRFAGLQAYHGRAQHLRSAKERRDAIAVVVEDVKYTRKLIEAEHVAVPLVTGAGTGTMVCEAASGVYGELQAGSFLFMDADYGANERDPAQPNFEHALFVKTQVISSQAEHAVCDAGHKSHAIDSGLPKVLALDAQSELEFANGGDEHGILRPRGASTRVPAIGRMLWLVPGHCDPTVNLHDHMIGVKGGLQDGVVDRILRVDARGALTDAADNPGMSPFQVIVLATPVFFALIAIEFAWGWKKRRNTYRLDDAINSIALGMLSQVTAVLMPLFTIGIYTAVYETLALWRNDALWTAWQGWLLALVFYDFCYYWLHRFGHESAILWAAHVVHHQSQDYNLSTALRQTSTGPLLAWLFYVPMALAGVPPLVFGVVALIDLLYQFWVHTEHVPKLGWFDRWFCSPSNHRVHHAVNDEYLDRNYGGVLVVWDRLFGTFKEEGAKCVYGTRSPLNSWDPLWSNAEVYWALAQDSWRARHWADKLRVWIKPPGWRPADVAARFPRAPFDMAKVERFQPALTKAVAWFGAIQFVVLLQCVALFLWNAHRLETSQLAVWLAALTAGLWAVGAVLQGRITMLEALFIEACALSTATGAESLVELHRFFKPLAMAMAILCVVQRLDLVRTRSRFGLLLAGGLAFSLAGDCFLMVPGYFIPGLVAFLLAHLFYIALFRQGVSWFPDGRALGVTLAVGGAMYAFLFPHLDAVLKIAVACYVVVIACMAAQAIGRAAALHDKLAMRVAAGACFFMLSDSLLATNKFAIALPMAQFGVLATYYVAQALIACNAAPPGAVSASPVEEVPALAS